MKYLGCIFFVTALSLFCFCMGDLFAVECEDTYAFRGISCEGFKAEILEKGLYEVYREKPVLPPERPSLSLAWHGMDLLLPLIDVESVYVTTRRRGGYEVILKTGDGFCLTAFSMDNTIFKDIYGLSTLGGSVETTPEGEAATTQMFGGPVAFLDLLMMAYDHTPDEITCCKKNRDADIAISVLMILKGGGPHTLVAAFEGVGKSKGLILELLGSQGHAYQLNMPDASGAQILQVTYCFPSDSANEDLPFRVGLGKSRLYVKPPLWLAALNRALASSLDVDWKRYAVAARECGISEKSISRSFDNLGIKDLGRQGVPP